MSDFSGAFTLGFYSGRPIASDFPEPYQVAIAGLAFMVDWAAGYNRQSIPSLREASDQGAEPGEQSLTNQGAWKRDQYDWRGGAGQEHFDRPDSASPRRRFRASKGVNPWEPGVLALQREAFELVDSAETSMQLLVVGGELYEAHGTTLRHTADPFAGTPSWTTPTGLAAANVLSMTTNGETIWVAQGGANVLRSASVGGNFSTLGALTPDLVAYANGRLLGVDATALFEIDAAGAKVGTDLLTLHAGETVVAIAAAPNGIYAAWSGGTRGGVYYIGIDTDGSLAVPIHALPLPEGEAPTALAIFGRLAVVGTTRGVRVCAIGDDNGLELGPRIVTPGPVQTVVLADHYAWFGLSDYDGTSTGLGRLWLGSEVGPLQPPWATDVLAVAQGEVVSAAVWWHDDNQPRLAFAVAGAGIYLESLDTLVPSGTLDSGWIEHGTTERKLVSAFDVRHEPLDGTVEVSLIDEREVARSLGTNGSAGTLGPPSLWSGQGLAGERFRVRLTLTRDGGDDTTGPRITRWGLRARVRPFTIERIRVPLLAAEHVLVGRGNRADRQLDPLEVFLTLKGLEAAGAPVQYQEGRASYLVTIESVGVVEPDKMTDDFSFFDGLIWVELQTLEPTS